MASVGSDTDSETDFVENFLENVLSGNDFNPLLSTLHSYRIEEEDVVGEIYHLSLNFLRGSSCPDKLVCPLSCLVQKSIAPEDLETCRADRPTKNSPGREYNILKLQNVVRSKIFRVCQNLTGKVDFQSSDELRENSAQDGGDVVDHASGSLLSQLKDRPDYLSNIRFSSYAIKNKRPKMEDAHIIVPDLSALFGRDDCPCTTYCGIFDGHVGEEAAVYSATHLHRFIVENEHYKDDLKEAIRHSFVKTDEIFCSRQTRRSGTTAVVSLVRGKKLYIAWLGDSEATLYRDAESAFRVVSHKPGKESEKKRIEAAGGFVSFYGTWRVMGLLAVSRAIGDPDYKPYVTADPDVAVFDLDGTEDMVIMGSDGVWDAVNSVDAHRCVIETLQNDGSDGLQASARELVNLAKSLGSADNITAVVIFLREIPEILAAYGPVAEARRKKEKEWEREFAQLYGFDTSTPSATMNDVTSSPGNDAAVWPNPADLKSAYRDNEGNNGFADNNGAGDSSGGSSPYPGEVGMANLTLNDPLSTNGNGHHHDDEYNGASDDGGSEDDHAHGGADGPPVPATASGMTYGDLSPEHAGFYPEHSSVEPGFPNKVNLPGDLPEVAEGEEEEEEEERKQVEALVAAEGHTDQLVIDRVSPTSEDVHSAISAIDTALLADQAGLVAEVEETAEEPLSDDDWNYVKPGTEPASGSNEDPTHRLQQDEQQQQQQNLNPFLEGVPAGAETPTSEEDDEMARYRLNPDANEFVPKMTGHEIVSPAPVIPDSAPLYDDGVAQHVPELEEVPAGVEQPGEAELRVEPDLGAADGHLVSGQHGGSGELVSPVEQQFDNPFFEKVEPDVAPQPVGEVETEDDHPAPVSSAPEFLQFLETQELQQKHPVEEEMEQMEVQQHHHQPGFGEDMDSPFSDSGAAVTQPVEPETAQIGEASEDEAMTPEPQTGGSFDDQPHGEHEEVAPEVELEREEEVHDVELVQSEDSFVEISAPGEESMEMVSQGSSFVQQEVPGESPMQNVQDIVEEHGFVEQSNVNGEIEIGTSATPLTPSVTETAFELQECAQAATELMAPSPGAVQQMMEEALQEHFVLSPAPEVEPRLETEFERNFEQEHFQGEPMAPSVTEQIMDFEQATFQETAAGSLVDFTAAHVTTDLLNVSPMSPTMRHVASEAFACHLMMPEEKMERSEEVENLTTAPPDSNIHSFAFEQREEAPVEPAPASVADEALSPNLDTAGQAPPDTFYSTPEEASQNTVFYSPESDFEQKSEDSPVLAEQLSAEVEQLQLHSAPDHAEIPVEVPVEQQPEPVPEPVQEIPEPVQETPEPVHEIPEPVDVPVTAEPIEQTVVHEEALQQDAEQPVESDGTTAAAVGVAAVAGVAVAGAAAAVAAKKKPGVKSASAPRTGVTKPGTSRPGTATTRPASKPNTPVTTKPAVGSKVSSKPAGSAKPAVGAAAPKPAPARTLGTTAAKKPAAMTATTANAVKKTVGATATAAPKPAAAKPAGATAVPKPAAPKAISRPATAGAAAKPLGAAASKSPAAPSAAKAASPAGVKKPAGAAAPRPASARPAVGSMAKTSPTKPAAAAKTVSNAVKPTTSTVPAAGAAAKPKPKAPVAPRVAAAAPKPAAPRVPLTGAAKPKPAGAAGASKPAPITRPGKPTPTKEKKETAPNPAETQN